MKERVGQLTSISSPPSFPIRRDRPSARSRSAVLPPNPPLSPLSSPTQRNHMSKQTSRRRTLAGFFPRKENKLPHILELVQRSSDGGSGCYTASLSSEGSRRRRRGGGGVGGGGTSSRRVNGAPGSRNVNWKDCFNKALMCGHAGGASGAPHSHIYCQQIARSLDVRSSGGGGGPNRTHGVTSLSVLFKIPLKCEKSHARKE